MSSTVSGKTILILGRPSQWLNTKVPEPLLLTEAFLYGKFNVLESRPPAPRRRVGRDSHSCIILRISSYCKYLPSSLPQTSYLSGELSVDSPTPPFQHRCSPIMSLFFLFFFWGGPGGNVCNAGDKCRASHMLGKSSTTELYPQPLTLSFLTLP